jgi:hypothetical protein
VILKGGKAVGTHGWGGGNILIGLLLGPKNGCGDFQDALAVAQQSPLIPLQEQLAQLCLPQPRDVVEELRFLHIPPASMKESRLDSSCTALCQGKLKFVGDQRPFLLMVKSAGFRN